MDLTCFRFNSTDESPRISLENPGVGLSQECDIDACLTDLHDLGKFSLGDSQEDRAAIQHWWERKWQVSLDYYLSSEPTIEAPQRTICPKSLRNIDLALCPAEAGLEKCSPLQALVERKTHRKFQSSTLPQTIFSVLLWSLRDALFGDIWSYYLVVFDVEGVPAGIYLYCPREHGLVAIKQGLFRQELVSLLCGMSASLTASFALVLSVDLEVAQKSLPYERALRELYIDSGRLAQKILLKGMQYHVGGLPSPAMRDSPMCAFLGITADQCIPLYTVTMGIIAG